MVTLPVELWERITQLSGRKDLLILSLVSPTLRDAARRALAESITFHGSRESLDYLDVLKFLRDQNLVTCVKRFECKLRIPGAVIPFEDMINLQSLSFTAYTLFFGKVEDQKNFVDAIRRCCIQLVELEFEYHGPILDEYFAIPNLQKIIWNEHGVISAGFLSLCRASASTLTELDLTVWSNHDVGASRYVALSMLHFPNLRVLVFGTGGQHMPDLRPGDDHTAHDGYMAFLYAHKTIEHLTLTHRYLVGNEKEIYMPFNPNTVPKDIFPNLKYLSAHPMQILQFLESGAYLFMQNSPLATLCIARGLYDHLAGDWIFVREALCEYASRHGPVCIRRLIFNWGNSRSLHQRDFESCMRHAARALPDLDTWEGDVPQLHSGLQVFRQFKKLCKLRVRGVHIEESSENYFYLPSDVDADEEVHIEEPAAVWGLAQDYCHLLKEVHYGAGDDGYEIKRVGDQVVELLPIGRCLEYSHD